MNLLNFERIIKKYGFLIDVPGILKSSGIKKEVENDLFLFDSLDPDSYREKLHADLQTGTCFFSFNQCYFIKKFS